MAAVYIIYWLDSAAGASDNIENTTHGITTY